jgi:hypothetical protein
MGCQPSLWLWQSCHESWLCALESLSKAIESSLYETIWGTSISPASQTSGMAILVYLANLMQLRFPNLIDLLEWTYTHMILNPHHRISQFYQASSMPGYFSKYPMVTWLSRNWCILQHSPSCQQCMVLPLWSLPFHGMVLPISLIIINLGLVITLHISKTLQS